MLQGRFFCRKHLVLYVLIDKKVTFVTTQPTYKILPHLMTVFKRNLRVFADGQSEIVAKTDIRYAYLYEDLDIPFSVDTAPRGSTIKCM